MRNARTINFSMKNLTSVSENVFQDALWAEVTAVDFSQNKLESLPLAYVIN